MARLEGKVAFITGVARGQGRSHALRLASEGADIIGVDICADFDSVAYPMASRAELDETVALVEKLDRRMIARVADVRDLPALRGAVEDGVQELGRLDFIVANAGISPGLFRETTPEEDKQAWDDVIGVNLTGVWNATQAGIPHIVAGGRGGSIVLTGSTAGLRGMGGGGYGVAKHGVVGIMRGLANDLAPQSIRVNVVHPTAVNTLMATNEVMLAFLSTQVEKGIHLRNALPVDMVEPADISAAIAFLLSDDARYITGTNLPVDAGFVNRIG
ncbi:MAG: family mycofactocin-dependent oxidoreductase [Frankiales bacterium]|nr:family mycofactocin-dependent oxidoreductase [Frankiales bacterium]